MATSARYSHQIENEKGQMVREQEHEQRHLQKQRQLVPVKMHPEIDAVADSMPAEHPSEKSETLSQKQIVTLSYSILP